MAARAGPKAMTMIWQKTRWRMDCHATDWTASKAGPWTLYAILKTMDDGTAFTALQTAVNVTVVHVSTSIRDHFESNMFARVLVRLSSPMPVTVCHHADLGVRVVIATDVVLPGILPSRRNRLESTDQSICTHPAPTNRDKAPNSSLSALLSDSAPCPRGSIAPAAVSASTSRSEGFAWSCGLAAVD